MGVYIGDPLMYGNYHIPYEVCSGARFQRSEELGFCCDGPFVMIKLPFAMLETYAYHGRVFGSQRIYRDYFELFRVLRGTASS